MDFLLLIILLHILIYYILRTGLGKNTCFLRLEKPFLSFFKIKVLPSNLKGGLLSNFLLLKCLVKSIFHISKINYQASSVVKGYSVVLRALSGFKCPMAK